MQYRQAFIYAVIKVIEKKNSTTFRYVHMNLYLYVGAV